MCAKIVDFYEKYDAPIALALGFFDCIHIGHKRLATKVIEYAQSHNDVQSALFTFSNDPNTLFNKTKEIYSFEDRVCVLDNLGIDVIVKASFDESFMSTSPRDFLLKLIDNKNIRFIAVGADVMFAYNTTIGSNLFTVIPLTVGITFQPYVWRFEFPITLNVGAALENYLQYNYFPGLILKGEAGCFYRMNENWSFGLECQLMYLPQWYSDSSKNDYYLGITATVGARYHF